MNSKNRLSELRINDNLTQTELANYISKKTGHIVTQKSISAWEKGRSFPKPFQLQFLEDFFRVPKEDIFFAAFNYKNELKTN